MPENQPSIITQIVAETWEHPVARVARVAAVAAIVGHALRVGKALDAADNTWHDFKEDLYARYDQRQMEAQYDKQ